MFKDLQQFKGTNLLVTPDPDILRLCQDYIREHRISARPNAAEASLLIDAIQADSDPAAPTYLKSFDWVVSDAATLDPAGEPDPAACQRDRPREGRSHLHLAQGVWGRQCDLRFNGTEASKDTTITFDNTPGHYLFEVVGDRCARTF